MAHPTYRPMLTTEDNPFNPFTHYDEWYNWDISNGYNTCGLIARIVNDDDVFSVDAEATAMEDVVKYNLSGKHLIVTEESFTALLES